MPKLKLLALLTIALLSTPAAARDIIVQMKNRGADGTMVFEPAVVKAKVGDRVRFVPTDPSHNAETIPGIWPAGQAPIKGALNKEVVLEVKAPGIYGIKCLPHYSMGMVALVIAGKSNLTAARATKMPPLATKRLKPALDAVR
ncbi:pseudoazurin [Sphingopyxis sp.]|jgi:pseudoazurin|uniref:pseudoazurin n=1 Tax=Sphingopyxis sp. TaxID=1908224 RepID=UPI003F7162DF